ncbi:YcaO-like family protein [Streptomyces sp. NPDC055886]
MDVTLELFLRQDSVFLETPEGVLLRGGEEDFFLKGKSAYRWLTALAPALSEGCTEEQLRSGLDAQRSEAVGNLVAQLVRSGFLRERRVESAELLNAEVRFRFAEQIAFLAHYGDTPQAAFRKVRSSRVLVVGEGPGALAAVRMLLRNGVHAVALCGADAEAPQVRSARDRLLGELFDAGVGASLDLMAEHSDERIAARAAAWEPDAMLAVPEGPSAKLLDLLAAHAAQNGLSFLPGRLRSGKIMLGPLLTGGSSPCERCFQLRLAESGPAAFPAESEQLFPAVAAAAGSELAADLFKQLSGCMRPESAAAVVIRDPLSLESTRELLSVHPACPSCMRRETPADFARSLEELAVGGHDLPSETAARSSHHAAVTAPTFGELAGYDDDELPQLLVKTGRVRRAAEGGSAAVGHSFDTLQAARVDAVQRLVRHHAVSRRAPAFLPTRVGSCGELMSDGQEVLPAERFSALAPGDVRSSTGQAAVTWVPALSLAHRTAVWIPRDVAFDGAESTSSHRAAGYGAGATFEETVTSGLLSALLHERLRDRIAGRAGARDIELPSGSAGKDLAILPSVRRLAGGLHLSEITGETPVSVVVARADAPASGKPLQVAAVGVTRTAALRTAVLELAGMLQGPQDGPYPDRAETLACPDDWPRLGTHAPAGDQEPPGTPAGRTEPAILLDALRRAGREAVYVTISPPTGASQQLPALCGRVLLTH